MIRKVVLIVISILTFCLVFTSAVQAVTTVTTSVTSINYTENEEIYIDPDMIVNSDATFEYAMVFIGTGYLKGEDYLSYEDTNNISGSFDSSYGILTLSGRGDAAAYQAAFRNIRYVNTNEEPHTCTREIVYVLGNTTPYFPENHHYYESIYSSSPISWTDARSAAENRSFDGLQGYLVTINSDEENDFIGSKIDANAWIGASDENTEGQWEWVTGPEAGTLFYSGNYPGNAIGYNNWVPGKPNDFRDGEDLGEDYAHIYGASSEKNWNDCPDEDYIQYYIVEYGDMPGEELPQLTATMTVNVISVNDIPATPGDFTSPLEGQIVKGGSSVTVNWGASTDAEGDFIGYDLWFFNGSWIQIGKMLSTNSMVFNLPEDNTDAMFRVYANDTQDNSSARDVTFTIDSAGPVYTWVQKVLNASTGDNVTLMVSLTDISEIVEHNITIDGQVYEMKEGSGNYYWNISIPESNTGNISGSIIYNCTFSDSLGNVNSTGDILINVSIIPYAIFDASDTIGAEPFSVNFTDRSLYTDSWYWDFDDGSTTDKQNPSHVFNTGNFTVRLTAFNSNGSSSKTINIKVLERPEYTIKPEATEKISIYGDETNFSVISNLLSSFKWFIDGAEINGTGVTCYSNNNDSSNLSYCLINTSQYINQSDFFMDTFNISVAVSNESTGTAETLTWEWIVTDSSAENSEDICFVVVREANLTKTSNQTIASFNTIDETKKDDTNMSGSLTEVAFNAPDNVTNLLLKLEVIKKSSLNESETGFSTNSVYQHMDIRVNNKTLVNESENRSMEFRVLNELDGGILNVTSIQLKHKDGSEWESYEPELLYDDGTYSYYRVSTVSGFSPFAITATYVHADSSKDDEMPVYLKESLLKKTEENSTPRYEETKKGMDAPVITGELSSEQETISTSPDSTTNIDNLYENRIARMLLTASVMIIIVFLSIMFLINKTKER